MNSVPPTDADRNPTSTLEAVVLRLEAMDDADLKSNALEVVDGRASRRPSPVR
jgi:hypothetical protein